MREKLQALVIDDDPDITSLLAEILRQQGWEVTEAGSAKAAIEQLTDRPWGAVFCDIRLGGREDGFSVLRAFKQQMPAAPVVLMTGYGSALGALDASSFGAYDYILKPFGIEEVQSISQALKEEVLNYRARRIRSPVAPTKYQTEIRVIGRSAAFIDVMKKVGRFASTGLPVLLTGESGTGKEVIASSLHSRSQRRDFPFVTVNCGAISAELIESELFGHVKGAFTGADRDRQGLWAAADKGTVFLDEITETTPTFQVKLLRALQQGEIRPVGSNETFRVDVRVIAASNRNVEGEVAAGRFREDLFYRLNAVSIRLPPLRERREDILLLAKSFAEGVFSLRSPVTFSPEALELLQRYPWPGNIRELENAVVLATALSDGTIRAANLPERVKNYSPDINAEPSKCTHSPQEILPLAVMEGRYVKEVLARTSGNKQAASRLLGIDRKRLDRIIKRHDTNLST
ncbi:MAG TPA: sigma-54 dependent transcriptional regulator [Pyrinomonadaceae bacterium]